jgi:hypothetical protein
MKKVVQLVGIISLGAAVFGCSGKEPNKPVQENSTKSSNSLPDISTEKTLALKFLQGIQNGDKNSMFEATNLTPAIANDCRDKLIYRKKYKQSEAEIKGCEKLLEVSGQIDFYSVKIKQNLPKSSSFQILDSKTLESPANTRITVSPVKITYNNQAEAMIDKTQKPVKEMIVQMYHTTQQANGRWLHEFTLDNKDVKVVSYY